MYQKLKIPHKIPLKVQNFVEDATDDEIRKY